MADNFSKFIYLIVLSPALIFLVLMLSRFFAVNINRKLIGFAVLTVSGFNTAVLFHLYKAFADGIIYENLFPFIKINNFVIPFGIYIDKTGLIFTTILFLVSFLVQMFSISYMKDETKQYRFFALINIFTSFLAALFLSPNLIQTYVFWELAGVISYLLIGFEYDKPTKSLASKKVFIINRIGDTSFLAGILICSYYLYKFAPLKNLVSLPFSDINIISDILSIGMTGPILITTGLLFIIAAVVKSAQFPFYTWLQDAMEAKLPVSALLHSATLVALGAYLCIRLFPFYLVNPILIKFVMHFGLVTMLLCSLFACVQNNPKKVLAYSTSAQLGLIFFAIGILNIKAAVVLFVLHALIKSMLFITLPDNDNEWTYTKFGLFLFGGVLLSAVKEILTCRAEEIGVVIVISLVSFLTAFYMLRITLVIKDNNGLTASKDNILEYMTLAIFLLANIVLYIKTICKYHISLPLLAAFAGYVVVYVLYKKKAFFKIPYVYPVLYNGLYLDKFYMTGILYLYEKLSNLLSLFDTKILGNYKPLIYTADFLVKVVNWIEINIMNKSVFIVADISRRISAIGKQLQTSNVQWYNFYGFIIITVILSVLVIAYSAIMAYIRGV